MSRPPGRCVLKISAESGVSLESNLRRLPILRSRGRWYWSGRRRFRGGRLRLRLINRRCNVGRSRCQWGFRKDLDSTPGGRGGGHHVRRDDVRLASDAGRSGAGGRSHASLLVAMFFLAIAVPNVVAAGPSALAAGWCHHAVFRCSAGHCAKGICRIVSRPCWTATKCRGAGGQSPHGQHQDRD